MVVVPPARVVAYTVIFSRAGDEAADVEEAEAVLVLLVGLLGAVGDSGVEEDDGGGVVGWHDDAGGAGDADLHSPTRPGPT